MKIRGLEIDINKIAKEDMPNIYFEDIYDLCGADVAVKILDAFSGCTIQVPKRGFKKIEKRLIFVEYDGSAICIQRLARKFDTTEKYIRDVLSSGSITPPTEGQIRLFDEE